MCANMLLFALRCISDSVGRGISGAVHSVAFQVPLVLVCGRTALVSINPGRVQ